MTRLKDLQEEIETERDDLELDKKEVEKERQSVKAQKEELENKKQEKEHNTMTSQKSVEETDEKDGMYFGFMKIKLILKIGIVIIFSISSKYRNKILLIKNNLQFHASLHKQCKRGL